MRSRRLFFSQCTAGFPGAAASYLITPFLLFASCLLAVCCVDASASCTHTSASLPSLTPPLPSPPLPLNATAIASILKCTVHPPGGQLLFSDTSTTNAASCPPQLLVLMPLAMPRLLWCLKIAQSTHSHCQNSNRVLQMVSRGWYVYPIREGGSGSWSGMRLDNIC